MDDAEPSSTTAGSSSRTASSSTSARAIRRPRRPSRTSVGALVRPASSTRTTTCTRTSPAPGRRRATSSVADELYPLWSQIDPDAEYAAARTGPGGAGALRLPRPCSTTTTSSRAGRRGSSRPRSRRPSDVGVRLVASRGSMDVGQSDGGLPPDDLVEDPDDVLADTEGLAVLHEDGPGRGRRSRSRPARPFSGLEAAHARVGRARPRARPAPAHAPGRDRRGGGVLPGHLRVPPDRVPRAGGLARGRRLVRALRPPLARRRPAELRPGGHRGRPLPQLEPPPGRRHRARARDARRGGAASGSASTARPRTSAPTCSARRSRRSSSRAAGGPGR